MRERGKMTSTSSKSGGFGGLGRPRSRGQATAAAQILGSLPGANGGPGAFQWRTPPETVGIETPGGIAVRITAGLRSAGAGAMNSSACASPWLLVDRVRGARPGRPAGARGTVLVVVCALLCVAAGFAATRTTSPPARAARARSAAAAAPSSPTSRRTVVGLPVAAREAMSRGLGRDDPGYWIRSSPAGWRASNAKQRLAVTFASTGAVISVRGGWIGLGAVAVGRGSALRALGAVRLRVRSNRVVYQHPGVGVWYANGPLGLEQGFSLTSRPAGAAQLPVTLAVRLTGTLRARLRGNGLLLVGGHDRPRLRYDQLSVTDATGRRLPARLSLSYGWIEISIRDHGARYPLTVDPTVTQTAELTASDGAANDNFGSSVAVSGSTIVVGAPQHQVGSNTYQGAVYVFTKPASGWANATQTAELTASDGAANDNLGLSVAVSGSTIVAGAPGRQVGQGAVYVFSEPASGWANGTQTAELTASDGAAYDQLGWSVGVSGSTVVAGANEHWVGGNGYQGAVYVFSEPASGWADSTETAELTASDGGASDGLGISVAVSGSTIVAGAGGHQVGGNTQQGAAYVFSEPAGGWANSTETAELTAADGASGDLLEFVGLSGSTVVAGAPYHQVGSNSQQGAAYEFDYPPSAPTTTTTALSSSPNPATVGQQVSYTATVSPAPDGGTVAFSDGGGTIFGCGSVAVNTTTGEATCPVTYSTAGSHSITASYSGDGHYSRSSSSTVTQVINQSGTGGGGTGGGGTGGGGTGGGGGVGTPGQTPPTMHQLKQAAAAIASAAARAVKRLTVGQWSTSFGVSVPGAGTVCTIVLLGSKAGPFTCGSTHLLHAPLRAMPAAAKHKHRQAKPTMLASGAHTFARAGRASIVLRFTNGAKKLLGTGKTQRATMVIAYITSGHAPVIITKQ